MILAALAVVRLFAPEAYAKIIRRVTSGAVNPRTQLGLESKLAALFIFAFILWTLWDWVVPGSTGGVNVPQRNFLHGRSSSLLVVALGFLGVGLLMLFKTQSALRLLTRGQVADAEGFPRGSLAIARIIAVALIGVAAYILLTHP